MTGLFSANTRSLGQLKRNLIHDVGNRMRDEMKRKFEKLPSYYYSCSNKKESIVFDETAKIVGSEEWAVAASDTGGDWKWSSLPPLDKILVWVEKHSGIQGKRAQRAYAIKTQRYIKDVGIDSHYWVDRYLTDFMNNQQNGSGMI